MSDAARALMKLARECGAIGGTELVMDAVSIVAYTDAVRASVLPQGADLLALAGSNPADDPIPPGGLAASVPRLRAAMNVQQPEPVPDQLAIVWRLDLIRLWGDWTHKRAYFEHNTKWPAAPAVTAPQDVMRLPDGVAPTHKTQSGHGNLVICVPHGVWDCPKCRERNAGVKGPEHG